MTSSRLIAAAALAYGLAARAQDVSVSSTTLVGARAEGPNDVSRVGPPAGGGFGVTPALPPRTVAPFYELVGLRVRNLDTPAFQDLGITLDAWGSLTVPGAPPAGLAGDVNLLFVEGRTFQRRLGLRVGRQSVFGGAARFQYFDGVSAEVRGPVGLGVSAFVGQPVAARFGNFLRADLVTGGRLFWAPTFDAQVGLSVLHSTQAGALVRQDVGADARWRLRNLTLTGMLSWSVAEKRLVELDVGPRFQPLPALELTLNYRRSAPDLFLPRNSIFSVFADTSRDDLGASLFYQLGRAGSVYADGRALWINGELGYELALRAAVAVPGRRDTNASVQLRRLSLRSNGVLQGRVGARHVLPMGLGLAVDLEAYGLDAPVRGKSVSVSGSASGTWQWGPAWLLGVTCFAGSTPYVDSRVELMAKLTYVFDKPGRAR